MRIFFSVMLSFTIFTTSGLSASAATAKPKIQLTEVISNGSGSTKSWTLNCSPVSGTHPNAKAACSQLLKLGIKALSPTPAGYACTQIYGGPEKATLTGTWSGKKFRSTFSRTDGCQIARWENLSQLLLLKS
ncbi:MAG: SSI family serine proteinase inhibitor [Actinomycetes bacterium]